MACYFTFFYMLMNLSVVVAQAVNFTVLFLASGWDIFLDGCPGCGYGAASEEDLKRGYYESQMTNFCFHCSASYGGEYCPKCYADDVQQGLKSQTEHEARLQSEQINFENKRRAGIEEDIPF